MAIRIGLAASIDTITLYNRPVEPTYHTSYDTYDEGWQIANGTFDGWNETTASGVFCRVQTLDYTDSTSKTLLYNNPFGNKLRFTDASGSTTYNDIMIDNLTGIMWYWDNINTVWRLDVQTYQDILPLIAAYTDSEGNSDYFLPTRTIASSVVTYTSSGSTLTNTDFRSTGVATTRMVTCTTVVDITTSVWTPQFQNRAAWSSVSKTGNQSTARGVPCRIIPQPITPNP